LGSAWASKATQSAQLRLVWDGKDGAGFLEGRGDATGRWKTISAIMTAGDVEGDPKNEKKIGEFRRAAEGFSPSL